MKLALLPRILANAGQNGNGGGILIHRRWVDERGNPASWKIILAINQQLVDADEQRGREQA
jgi:hypothetical protein